jgi:hypothetical protein
MILGDKPLISDVVLSQSWFRREGEATLSKLKQLLLVSRSVSLSLLLFSHVGKEAGRRWEIVREDVGCAQE